MSKLKFGATAPVLAAGAIALGLGAPAAASAHTAKVSKATVAADVKSAKTALSNVRHHAHTTSAVRKGISSVNAQVKKAATDSFVLTKADPTQGTTALCSVANLLSSEASTYTQMLTGSTGALSSTIATAIKPALNAESYLLALCNDLTSVVPSSSATAGLSSVSSTLSTVASTLNQLSSLLSSGDFGGIESILSGALNEGSTAADSIIAQLEALIPDLPAADQAQATALLNQLKTAFAGTSTALSGAGGLSGISTLVGSELNMASSWLNELMGGISSLLGGGTVTGTSGTSTSGTSTSTSIAPPAGLSGLLNQLGFGSIFNILGGSNSTATGTGSTGVSGTTASTNTGGLLGGLFGNGGLLGSLFGNGGLLGGLFGGLL